MTPAVRRGRALGTDDVAPRCDGAAASVTGGGCADRARAASAMTIGEAAEASGISPKMIGYYERIGLVPPAARERCGYRLYGPADVDALRFVKRARDLGFPVRMIAHLLALGRDRGRSNAEVRPVAERHAKDLRRRLAELEGMLAALERLLAVCPGDGGPDCPILDSLAGGRGQQTVTAGPTPYEPDCSAPRHSGPANAVHTP